MSPNGRLANIFMGMAPNRASSSNRRGQSDLKGHDKTLKRKRTIEDIEGLTRMVAELDPKSDTPLEEFSQLPLSQSTQDGLKASHFTKLTSIQSRGIPVALKGSDVLGAAKTGSGKTLSFVVPVLENLYRKRWTEYDGVGALILSPTRELAIQIFDVLRKVGRNHGFSAGLVIGGKSLQEEKDRVGRMNILVATPGRMLQHMDQTADLDVGNLQMLVLDEADRIMDMGFKQTVDAIVEHLPSRRQTMMFSATQTKKVSDLARLSLTDPEFVSVHEAAESATPSTLQQNYVITPLPEKLDTLWSFLRANVKKKILVFFSSGKQVRFVYEAMRHLQPGIPLLHLHGRQKQTARLEITTKFSNSMHACLFSTDVAARGLDFPAVDWVVQADCPEDADTYIHRAGRTARYERDGRAVLFLDPAEEEGMLAALRQKNVTGVEEIHVKQKKMQHSIRNQLQNMCFKDPELKYLGQKAFVSYVKSVYIQKDKSIFNVKRLDLEDYAASMGLPGAPRVKFVKGEDAKIRKNMPRALVALEDQMYSEEDFDENGDAAVRKEKEKPAVRTKYDRMFERRNQDVLADHYSKLIDDRSQSEDEAAEDLNMRDADEDDDFMAVKRRFAVGDDALGNVSGSDASELDNNDSQTNQNHQDNGDDDTAPSQQMATKKSIKLSDHPDAKALIVDSNRRSKLLKSKKALLKYKGRGSHVVFASDDDEDNTGREKVYYEHEEEFAKRGAPSEQRAKFLQDEEKKVRIADEVDREVAKEKRREKKIKRKEREKYAGNDNDHGDEGSVGTGLAGGEVQVQLAGDGVHIPIDLGPYSSNDDDEDDDEEQKRPPKRQRKWFEDPSSDEEDADGNAADRSRKNGKKKKTNKSRQGREVMDERDDYWQEPQNLEDLEAMASGLLAAS